MSNPQKISARMVLPLEVKPLELYEGEVLIPFTGENQSLDTRTDITTSKTGLYLETEITPPPNQNKKENCNCACYAYYEKPGDCGGGGVYLDSCLASCNIGGTDRHCAGNVCPIIYPRFLIPDSVRSPLFSHLFIRSYPF